MLKAKKLNIHTIDDPELIHIQKIGFHIMRFYEKEKRNKNKISIIYFIIKIRFKKQYLLSIIFEPQDNNKIIIFL